MKRNLLVSLDCTREYGADQFFACGATRVVDGVAGQYREAESKPTEHVFRLNSASAWRSGSSPACGIC